MMTLAVLFGILGLGLLLVGFGTAARNRFGINTMPVVCPRCGTSLPSIRTPENLSQALWGGGTCPVCATEVGKWGRQVPSAGRRGWRGWQYLVPKYGSGVEARTALKRRFVIVVAAVDLCLSLARFPDFGNYPSTPVAWLVFAGGAVLHAAFFGALIGLTGGHIYDRAFPHRDGEDITSERRSS